jgi:hypothetical protein
MHRRLLTLILTITVLMVAAAQAWALEGDAFVKRLDQAVASGELSVEEGLLYEFNYAFDPDALPQTWRPESFAPLKCGTDMMRRFEELRPTLSAETVKTFESQIVRVSAPDKATYLSPLGHFNLTYLTTGTDAVPTTDTDPANGIPDYVERCAEYMDESWEVEIVTMGFTAPPTHPYPISFESMSYYGYTSVVSGTATQIVLHNTFVGFPPNDDPDGNVAGAARATCAHEFKHASQRAQSGWSEGGWVELDATWMEDVVFDQVNDYYNYLPGSSGIAAPQTSLDDGGTGSYEDCIWQMWMSETYGNQIIIDLWNWRSSHTSEAMLTSYNTILGNYGTNFAAGHAAFTSWNFATSSRALAGLGYQEAADFPLSPATFNSTYPYVGSGTIAKMAAQFINCTSFSQFDEGTLRLDFDGDDGGTMGLIAVIKKNDGTGVIETVALDGNQDALYDLGVPLGQIASVGVIMSNNATSGVNRTWSLTVSKNILMPDPALTLNSGTLDLELDADTTGQQTLTLSNTGEVGSTLTYDVYLMSAVPGGALKSVAGSDVSCAQSQYLAGTTVTLDISVYNASTDDEWLTDVEIDFPAGVVVNSATSLTGGSAPLAFTGPTGDGVTANWHGNDGSWGALHGGETATGTVNVTFGAGLSGDQTFGWFVQGDIYGSTPHDLSGTFVLTASGPSVQVDAPNGGEYVAAGSVQDMLWTATILSDVKIELSRDNGGAWEDVLATTPNDGAESATFPGPASEQCLLRVGSTDGTTTDVSDAVFTIYDPVPWLAVDITGGDIAEGDNDLLTFTFDATGLSEGVYTGYVVIISDAATSPDVVTATLTVSDPGVGVGDAPNVFAIGGAYPNPFNPTTKVAFAVHRDGPVTIDVLDLQGRVVRTLLSQRLPAGPANVVWDGTDDTGRTVASGTYVARLRAGDRVATRKMTLAK